VSWQFVSYGLLLTAAFDILSGVFDDWLQRRRVVVQIVHQHKRHRDVRRQRHVTSRRDVRRRDVRRQRHVAVDGHLPQLVRHRRQVLPVRRTKLHDALLFLDLRRLPSLSVIS